ncbi:MAG: GNAT family N-acetyltransferase [Acinetobacter sp.]|jgi:ribosomal protein S18 acetylase RimI-like enzyme|uniref:Acetyltransferase (GNAT) domain-containing protein n=1 Tax=Acinetobacter albensis TaxID=1673609 RepID=A0A1C4GVU6_9GAMM|nr:MULTISPECIES: GNAT family N-acetyltransferase [Acinetobacter]ALD02513.1 GNAT family acetyltransferase [Acinetobacter sp. TTH0-4]MBE9402190.1 GNAT family N-acetyltransferase [Acinetobacter albensis]QPF38131.1 GNAT family N-acetyltransferase [Acinetobacter sp. TTH0-4]SCC72292.1 Acetyltransferase (GNAT) domain-containing protein [Acinetobacter albensis]
MPITVHAYTSLENAEVRSQLERLYDTSPEFGDGQDAIDQLELNLAQYTLVYTAEFNTKLIAAIWSTGQGESRTLENIVVHPANRGRGIADRLVSEVCRIEEEKGVKVFEPGCGAIHRCLAHLEKI